MENAKIMRTILNMVIFYIVINLVQVSVLVSAYSGDGKIIAVNYNKLQYYAISSTLRSQILRFVIPMTDTWRVKRCIIKIIIIIK